MRIHRALGIDHPVHPALLNAFNKDKDHVKEYLELLYSRHFLIMPCHTSPLLALIQNSNKWIYRYTDSFASLSMMLTIIQCFTANPLLKYYIDNKEHLDLCRAKWIEVTSAIDDDMNSKIQPLFDQKLNEKQTLERFFVIMESITLRRIQSYEICIAKMFHLPYEGLLTPKICPPASELTIPDQKGIPRMICHFFMMKQSILNDRLFLSSPDYVKRDYFDLKDMATRLETTPKEEIYKGYMDRYTAWEFFQFMKIE
jgi:hypothetical protein